MPYNLHVSRTVIDGRLATVAQYLIIPFLVWGQLPDLGCKILASLIGLEAILRFCVWRHPQDAPHLVINLINFSLSQFQIILGCDRETNARTLFLYLFVFFSYF